MAAKTVPLPGVPAPPTILPPDVAAAGPSVPAIVRLRIMSSAEWEDFILEWAHSLKTRYAIVEKCSGAGDMGRDVVGYVDHATNSAWDNFQCKHLDHPLQPGDIWVELGKLCYFTYLGEFSAPRSYSFVAPHGSGPALSKLVRQPEKLRARLLAEWDGHCKNGISSTTEVPLDLGLRDHVQTFDFSQIRILSPLTIIDDHRTTPWHAARFGGGLPIRPPVPEPPPGLAPNETVYVRALLDAYEDRLGATLAGPVDLQDVKLVAHFSRSRREFYSAEALREFSRDNVPSGTFDELLDEVHDGIIDVIDAEHADAVVRVLEAVRQAKSLQLTANALVPRITPTDRGGMCHQLSNEERVKWRP